METPERIWFLMSKNLSGDATPQESTELMQALQQQPGLMQQYELLQRLWKPGSNEQQEPMESGKISRILQLAAAEPTLQKGENSLPVYRFHKWKRVAKWAAMFVGLSVGVWAFSRWYNHSAGESSSANAIIAQKGSKTRTILPDGSTVWLNAGSRIVYEPAFTDKLREVTLEGEAYFDIVKQPDRPFIVHAGDINIRVLGTAFNVKSYKEDKTVETTLIRGLVQITRSGNTQQAIYLHPNQKIVLPVARETAENTRQVIKKNEDRNNLSRVVYIDSTLKEDEHIETAWVYNRLQFRGDSFEELAKKLERWYNINIYFDDEEAKQLTFNGSLENETVEQAFHALQAAVNFTFEIKNNEIYIKSVK
jgi:transmembrane sensor